MAEPMDPAAASFVALAFTAQTPLAQWGAVLYTVEPGAVSVSLPIGPGLCVAGTDLVMGGVVGLLGDVAAGLSLVSALAPPRPVTTVQFQVVMLAPAQGNRLVAEGRAEKAGKRQGAASAAIFAERGGARAKVALVTAVFAVAG